MSASPNRTPPVLRAALGAWPRHDRRASGDVLLATAQELIDDGGSSARREAFGIARSGAALRLRRLMRDCLNGPWADAAALAIIGCALIIAALVTAASGGPIEVLRSAGMPEASTDYSPGIPFQGRITSAAPILIVVSALGTATLAAARLRLLTLVALVVLGGLFVASYSVPSSMPITYEAALQYANAPYPGMDAPAPREAFIDVGGVIGLLLFAAVLTAGAWFAVGVIGKQRSSSAPMTALPPRLGSLGAAALVAVFAVLARRRRPAAAMGAVIVGAALWIPALWLGVGVVLNSNSLPWASVTGEAGSILIFWALTALLGCALGAATLRSAGRPANSSPDTPAPNPPDSPIAA